MKYYLSLLGLTMLIVSCNSDKKNNEAVTNNTKVSKEIQKENDPPKKESQVAKSIASTALNASKDSEEIKIIRERFNNINTSISNFTKKENKDISISKDTNPDNYAFESENIYRLAVTNVNRFYEDATLKKAIVKFEGSQEDLISEYYYWNDKIFFVFKTKINYSKAKWSDHFNESDAKKIESRFYFQNNKLIKWLDHQKAQIDLNSAETKKKEQEILSDSQLYKNLK